MNHWTSLVDPSATLRAWNGLSRVLSMDRRPATSCDASRPRLPRKTAALKPSTAAIPAAPRPWALLTPDRPCTAPAGHEWWPLLRS